MLPVQQSHSTRSKLLLPPSTFDMDCLFSIHQATCLGKHLRLTLILILMSNDSFKCYFPRNFFPIGSNTLSQMNLFINSFIHLFIPLCIYSFVLRSIIHLTVIYRAFAPCPFFLRYEDESSKNSSFMALVDSGGKY